MNPSGELPPDLSVILVTPDHYGTIRRTIRSLREQTVRDRLEIVIVAPSEQTLGLVESELDVFQAFRVIEFGEVKALAAARVAGIRGARASLVALAEDHAFPEPNWAEALINAHRGPWAAVGPAFINGNPGLMSWISLVLDYGRWMEPVAGGVTDDLAGHSSSWKRAQLLEYGSSLERMMQAPTIMHWNLQGKGHRLYLEPAARVRHFNISRLTGFVLDHLYGSWIFAAVRSHDWSWPYRLSYVGGSILLMPRTLRNWLRHFRRAGLRNELFPRAWPLLILALVAWTLGAMLGYGFGLGRTEERVLSMTRSESHTSAGVTVSFQLPVRRNDPTFPVERFL